MLLIQSYSRGGGLFVGFNDNHGVKLCQTGSIIFYYETYFDHGAAWSKQPGKY
jgi:hypothetical protein